MGSFFFGREAVIKNDAANSPPPTKSDRLSMVNLLTLRIQYQYAEGSFELGPKRQS
jgi:hypothetical protein